MKLRIVPEAWLSLCSMQRVITHWTAGGYKPGAEDLDHYHILVDNDGQLHRGHHTIADNVTTRFERYAAHTRGLNSGSIGVACCGMGGAQEYPYRPGHYPLKAAQYEAMLKVVADLVDFYQIPVDDHHVLNHGDVQKNLGITQNGKWDICILPFQLDEEHVGHYMRLRVKALLAR